MWHGARLLRLLGGALGGNGNRGLSSPPGTVRFKQSVGRATVVPLPRPAMNGRRAASSTGRGHCGPRCSAAAAFCPDGAEPQRCSRCRGCAPSAAAPPAALALAVASSAQLAERRGVLCLKAGPTIRRAPPWPGAGRGRFRKGQAPRCRPGSARPRAEPGRAALAQETRSTTSGALECRNGHDGRASRRSLAMAGGAAGKKLRAGSGDMGAVAEGGWGHGAPNSGASMA
mmetsp:Transcript_96426/g.299825  ORF Transcript_96426/g.299825 Transcript_96426/m.299825 type:complete len:229 (-) Transcript_96426:2-688(-)